MKKLTSQFLEILECSNCERCGGRMVDDCFFGKSEVFDGRRCVQCGNVIDPVILMNRLQPPVPEKVQDDAWDTPESIDLEDLPKVA